jgi:NAD(P)H dehydrogenase (quinone)
MHDMKIAITGASGQFGREATRLLLEGGVSPDQLILVTRSPQKLAARAAQGADVRQGDFDDENGLVEALAGAERMLMISGTRVGFREPQHRAAIDAAKRAGVRHIVYTSFVGAVDGNPSVAVRDHIATERMLQESGLTWTVLRDAQYADAVVEAMAPLILASGEMTSVAGDGRMAFVCRDDCVAGAVAVLQGEGHENKVYNLTGPELISYRELADLVADVTGTSVRFALTDEAGLYAMFDALGVPRQPVDNLLVNNFPWNSDDMVSFEVAVRDGHFAIISDDFERLTGRRPMSLRTLLEQHLDTICTAAARISPPPAQATKDLRNA